MCVVLDVEIRFNNQMHYVGFASGGEVGMFTVMSDVRLNRIGFFRAWTRARARTQT
jgi:hypothetical protein